MQTVSQHPPLAARLGWPSIAAATWLLSIAWVASQDGLASAIAGLVIATPIAALIVLTLLWLDRWQRGDPRRLISAFVWGASVAAFCAIWSQEGLQALVDMAFGARVGDWVRPAIITPVTEEGFKALFLIWLLVRRRVLFTGLLDGIVYGGLIGAGFSFTENSLYLGRALSTLVEAGHTDPHALTAFLLTLTLRVVLVPFMHPLLVAITGLGVAYAARTPTRSLQIGSVGVAFMAAIALHGVWDWAGIEAADRFLIFKAYGTVMVPTFIAMMIAATVLRRKRRIQILSGLPLLVARGLVSDADLRVIGSLRERSRRRGDARRRQGRKASRAAGRFHAEASALAIESSRCGRRASAAAIDARTHATAETRERAQALGSLS